MKVEYFTGFEHGGNVGGADPHSGDGYTSLTIGAGSSVSIVDSPVHGMHSKYALETVAVAAKSTVAYYGLATPDSAGELTEGFNANPMYVSFWYRCDVFPFTLLGTVQEDFFVIGQDSNFSLTVTGDRKIKIFGASGPALDTTIEVLAPEVWVFVEVSVYAGAVQADNWYDLKVDGVSRSSGNDFDLGTFEDLFVYLGKYINRRNQKVTSAFDELVISSGSFISGAYWVVWMVPNADGTYSAFTYEPGNGDFYNAVDERPWNTTDYLYTRMPGAKMSLNLESHLQAGQGSGIVRPIHAIRPVQVAYSNSDDPLYLNDIALLTRALGTDAFTDDLDLTASWKGQTKLYTRNFAAGNRPWTRADLDSLEVGARAGSSVQLGNVCRSTQVGVNVLFGGTLPEAIGPGYNLGG